MICNKFNSRKGFSLVHMMLFAAFITLFTSFLAYYLSSIKPSNMVSVTTLISADYQMESAIIMQMQRYKEKASNEPKSFEKEIMLGINMKVKCSKQANGEYLFEADDFENAYSIIILKSLLVQSERRIIVYSPCACSCVMISL